MYNGILVCSIESQHVGSNNFVQSLRPAVGRIIGESQEFAVLSKIRGRSLISEIKNSGSSTEP